MARPGAFSTALRDQRGCQRPRRACFLAACQRLDDEAGIPAGRIVQPGNPEVNEIVLRQRFEPEQEVRLEAADGIRRGVRGCDRRDDRELATRTAPT